VIYLTLPELVHIATPVLGTDPPIRDAGLLESAVARPQPTALGAGAYPALRPGRLIVLMLLPWPKAAKESEAPPTVLQAHIRGV
jgi:hypothetical protein